MTKKINHILSTLLIAINLIIAVNYYFVPICPQSEVDSNPLINNYIKDTNKLFNVVVTEYSSLKVNASLETNVKLNYTILILFIKEIECNLDSFISNAYNQIRVKLSLQRIAKILFPFHYYS